jgi:tetratricopeptide (TPR) repeat protein
MFSFSFAQKEVRQVKSYIKAGNNLTQAEKLMNDLLSKPENKTKLKYYRLAGDVQRKINDIENEKLYLKQKYDTAQFFNSIRKMFDIYERCDSVECDSAFNPKGNFKFRKENRDILLLYRANLANGGKYYLTRGKYKDAYSLLSTYIGTAYHPMFKQNRFLFTDKHLPEVASWATTAGHQLNDADKTLKYSGLALTDSVNRPITMEYMADAYKLKGDTANWVKMLEDGIFQYPKHTYFFVNLMDYFNDKSKYDDGLRYADTMLDIDSTSTLYLYAKVLALQNLHRYGDVINTCNKIISLDSTYVDAYYNIAVAYCNQALLLESTACVNVKLPQFKIDHDRILRCYKKARPYMEKVRALSPDDKNRWAPTLYRIYLNLNLGKEFDEIDKLLNSSNAGSGKSAN